MSDYGLADISRHSGEPIEFYRIDGPTSALSYYLTNYHEDILHGPLLYRAVPTARSNVKIEPGNANHEVELELPAGHDFALQYAWNLCPQGADFRIFRKHTPTGTARTYWQGIITGVAIEGGVCKLRSQSIFSWALSKEVPGVYYQNLCNHVLFDVRCQVVRASFDLATTITEISGRNLLIGSLGGQATNWFKGGEMVRDSDGERRLIVNSQTLTGPTRYFVVLNRAFRSLSVSDAVTLYAGCDHTIGTCRDKFSNAINFGGFPYITGKNIWRWGLKGI